MKTMVLKLAACKACGITLKELHSKSRYKEQVLARFFVMHELAKTKSWQKTGMVFLKDHSTAIYAKKIVETIIELEDNRYPIYLSFCYYAGIKPPKGLKGTAKGDTLRIYNNGVEAIYEGKSGILYYNKMMIPASHLTIKELVTFIKTY